MEIRDEIHLPIKKKTKVQIRAGKKVFHMPELKKYQCFLRSSLNLGDLFFYSMVFTNYVSTLTQLLFNSYLFQIIINQL
ncbi:hypothetical protein Niako_2879 [Niastella koreensis GR20-10]|uniref:Uncharacterized protein n=1 Tax=Niastella koreensis (strain DSM 17620 / KACC 11465 / NBRC 106392 / GR20-10) TaxID=700598 RepID=G8TAN2_NIAKG|nr:hypothetical protein Niako_2879 [Niastella koreensis GR20-10]